MKDNEKKCPKCAEVIKKEAVVCKHCGHQFSATEIAAEKQRQADASKNGAIGCVALLGLLALVGMCSSGEDEEPKSATSNESIKTIPMLSPEEQAALEKKNQPEINKVLRQAKALPASDLEGNERIYKKLTELAPGNAAYTEKRNEYLSKIALAATYQSNPERALEIANFSWEKGGFGSVQLVRFTVKNSAPFAIKDFELTCNHQGPSGTNMDRNVRVVYELVPANGSKRVREVNMGWIHNQVTTSRCEITDAVRA